jgi:hypothetical protein
VRWRVDKPVSIKQLEKYGSANLRVRRGLQNASECKSAVAQRFASHVCK